MTVQVRSKRLQSAQGRRHAAGGHLVNRAAPSPAQSVGDRRTREQPRRSLSNDRAVYKCLCGYVFEAPVSTSVGCPHCGGTQAW